MFRIEVTLPPKAFAMLCSYAYDLKKSDLYFEIECIDKTIINDVRFCYFEWRTKYDGYKYIMAIRGTTFGGRNIIDDAALMNPAFILTDTVIGPEAQKHNPLYDTARSALDFFEKKHKMHGRCAYATGHSLGGKLLEYLPDHIHCYSFNAYRNCHRENIIAYRMLGDPAGATLTHTDYWISVAGPAYKIEANTHLIHKKLPSVSVPLLPQFHGIDLITQGLSLICLKDESDNGRQKNCSQTIVDSMIDSFATLTQTHATTAESVTKDAMMVAVKTLKPFFSFFK